MNPSSCGLMALSQINLLKSSFPISSDNNHLVDFYTDNNYKLSNVISILCICITALAYILMLLGLISGKMIGI
jgi:hypothetical protein